MIESIHLQNFACHADTTVRLSPFTVLVGPNGTGKTAVLHALRVLSDLRVASRHSHNAPPTPASRAESRARDWQFFRRRSTPKSALTITARGANEGSRWTYILDDTGSAQLKFDGAPAVEPRDIYDESDIDEPSVGPASEVADFDRMAFLIPNPNALMAPSPVGSATALRADGHGIASVLANLKLTNDPRFTAVVERFRALVPEFRDLKFLPCEVGSGDGSKPGFRMSFDMASGSSMNPDELGDGALSLLHIVTFVATNEPGTVLIDGLDRYLHPVAQMALVKQLSELVGSRTQRQIIVTTHSPYVLDVVDAASVVVFAQNSSGNVAARSLAEHPERERLRGLSAGQLWTLDDETKWVFGDRT